MEVIKAHRLLNEIESALVAKDSESAAVLRSTLALAKPVFINLLDYDVPNNSSREKIQSGSVTTNVGVIPLDPIPDIQEILRLSDALQINELAAFHMVLEAREDGHELSAEAAAGYYFEERYAMANSLLLLLHAQIAYNGLISTEVYQTICAGNAQLLDETDKEGTVLVQRLLQLIRAASIRPETSSPLYYVKDIFGRTVQREDLMERECTIFCHSLLYATYIKQRITATDISDTLDLLGHLSLHAQTAHAGERLMSFHHANIALLSLILALLPLEGLGDETRLEEDKGTLLSLARNSKLDSAVRKINAVDSPFMAPILLAWGVMTLYCEAEDLVDRGQKDVETALDAGAFAFLGQFVLDSTPMTDETESLKYVASSIVYQLSCSFLEVSQQGFASLVKRSVKGLPKEFDEGGEAQSNGKHSMGVHGDKDQQAQQLELRQLSQIGPDSMATLLSAVAKALTVHPSLFQYDPQEAVTLRNLVGEVGRSNQLSNVPSVLVAYVDVLTALASGQDGARMVFSQLLSKDAPPLVSWKRVFGALSKVVELYKPRDHGRESHPDRYGRTSSTPSISSDTVVLPSPDTKALCAFSNLLARVMSQGSVDEVFSWLRQLDDVAGVSPCWELLFRVMCSPVPQSLKAALNRTIASISRRSDLAIALWDRLVSAVVVQPLPRGKISSTISQYDLRYQLNEIEARSEDYQEVLAFVELLNSLWLQTNQEYRDAGCSLAHFTRFVREDLLGTIFQRSFKSETQRWELLDACFAHCRIVMQQGIVQWPRELLLAEVQRVLTRLDGTESLAASLPPSLDVLFDMLNERSGMRAVLTTLAIGVEDLSFARQRNVWGKAQEGAVLSALRLFNTGFYRDTEIAEMFDASSLLIAKSHGKDGTAIQSSGIPTMDTVLQHDRTRILDVFQYVGYPQNDAIQEEALKLTALVADRIPNLVQLLLSAVQSKYSKFPGPNKGAEGGISYLQEGFAACLHSALLTKDHGAQAIMSHSEEHAARQQQTDMNQGMRDGVVEEEDARAGYLLQTLIACLVDHPTPNLTQLLCGFDLSTGMAPLALLDPRASHTVLREILDVLEQPEWAAARPRTFERCLELVCALLYAPDTGPAILHLLQSRRYQSLRPLMTQMGAGSLSGSGTASHAHSRAWLLRLAALEIQSADLAVPSQYESVRRLMRELFIDFIERQEQNDFKMVEELSSTPLVWHFLSTAVDDIPQPPLLASPKDFPMDEEVYQLLRHLEVEKSLSSGSFHIQGTRGDVIVDVAALKDDLLARYNEWTQHNGPPTAALKEACRTALTYAAAFNAYAESMGGRAAVLEAWHSLMVVAFSKRFDVIVELLQDGVEIGSGGEQTLETNVTPSELLFHSIEKTMAALNSLFRTTSAMHALSTTDPPNSALSPALGAVLQVLVARSQAHISHFATVDPLGSMPLPMQCHALLDGLLSLVWDAQRKEDVRSCLYHALCGYVGITNGPAVLRSPPPIVAAFINASEINKGLPVGEQLDALQYSIEEGSFQVIQKHSKVMSLLAADISSPNPSLTLASLSLLSSLVTLDLTGAMGDHLHEIGLPGRLLTDIGEATLVHMSNPAVSSELYYSILDAKLTLLLRITMTGPPAKKNLMAERVFLLHAVDRLSRAQVLDGMGSSIEPHKGSRACGELIMSIFSQSLRLVLLLTSALPHSVALKEQLAQFVEAHSRSLVRCLRHLGGDGGDDPLLNVTYTEGEGQHLDVGLQRRKDVVELAALVANLLGLVDWGSLSSGVAANLMEASMRVFRRFFAQNSKSRVPFLMRLEAARQDGPLSLANHQVYLQVITLRVALASQLNTSMLFSPSYLSLLSIDSGEVSLDGFVELIKDAMVQCVLKDLPEAQQGLSHAMNALQRGSKDAISVQDVAMSLLNPDDSLSVGVAVGSSDIFTVRSLLAKLASLCHTQINKLVILVEHFLSLISVVFKSSMEDRNGKLKVSRNTQNEMRRLIEPALASIERLVQSGVEGLSIDTVSLDLLVRRARESLWMEALAA